MASAKVITFEASQDSARQVIPQKQLLFLLALRGRLAQLERDLADEEEAIKVLLLDGARIEPGDHFAELKEQSRRHVAWKDVVVRLAERLELDGEVYCARVLAATKPTKTISLEVR